MLKQRLFTCLLVSWTVILFLHPVYSAPINRKLFVNFLVSQDDQSEKYAVIFDAGSTGSRVHVFHFDKNLDLLQIGQDFEFFEAISPGLSSYADDPEAAAASLKPLLEKAEAIVPEDLRPSTPLKLGATAGLRLLPGSAAENILQAVRDLFQSETSLNYKAEWVNVLEGSQEAAYLWVAINYLLGTAGKPYSETVGTIDLGGGSVEITYAVSKEDVASRASKLSLGDENYIQELYIRGTTYHLYAYSYLNYGLLAGRAEVLKVSRNLSHPCIPYGYHGYYSYNGEVYRASALPFGSNINACKAYVLKALNIDAPCERKNCTFNGVWNGGGGPGQDNLYVASFFYDKASQVGMIPPDVPSSVVRPADFEAVAKHACSIKYQDIISQYPNVLDNYMICLDLVYEYTLLVDGFGLDPFQNITLVNKINYKNSLVGAAWPLGSAIEAVSSNSALQFE